MDKNTISRVWRLGLILMLLSVMIGGLPVNASVQSQEQTEVASEIAFAEAPTLEEPVLYSSPPALTEEQVARMEWAVANTHGSPKMDTTVVGEVASPAPGTESFAVVLGYSPNAILAPNDPISYTLTEFGSAIPADYKSNVMESSTAGKGVEMFYTGNWFAANFVDKGHNWTFLSPYSDYPSFCCDQVTLYDRNPRHLPLAAHGGARW